MANKRKNRPLVSTTLTPPPGAVAPELGAGKRSRWILAAIVVLYLVLAGAYNAITPAGTADQHNPDENAHMLYVASVASGHLPIFTDASHGYENHQPPLYYFLCAPVYLITHGATHAVRWVSIVLGALLILVSYRCIRTIFPEDRWLALGTAAFVGLLPANVALNASVTNDSLTTLLMALGLWLIAYIAMVGPKITDIRVWDIWAAWLGVILGAGIWTKTLTLPLFAIVFFAYLLLVREKLVSPKIAAQSAAIALGFGLLFGVPWLLRNTHLYGDPLAQRLFLTSFGNTAQAGAMTHFVFHDSLLAYLALVTSWTFASFWGVFDSMRLFWGQNPHGPTPSPTASLPPLYAVPGALCLLSLAGLIRYVVIKPKQLSPSQAAILSTFAILVAVNGMVFLRFILTFFQAQGRYFYPALLPLALFFALGWRGLLPPKGFRVFVGLLIGGLLALNLYTLFGLLLPRFSSASVG